MSKEINEILNLIIEDALQGKIDLKNLYARWPFEENNSNEFYERMFKDIENAIEHTPFKFFTKKVNYKVWENTKEYKTLLFYKSELIAKK